MAWYGCSMAWLWLWLLFVHVRNLAQNASGAFACSRKCDHLSPTAAANCRHAISMYSPTRHDCLAAAKRDCKAVYCSDRHCGDVLSNQHFSINMTRHVRLDVHIFNIPLHTTACFEVCDTPTCLKARRRLTRRCLRAAARRQRRVHRLQRAHSPCPPWHA